MSKAGKGIISFDRYEVNKVFFELNSDYYGDEVEIKMDVDSKFQVDESGNTLETQLLLHVFPDAKNNKYPFEMEMQLTGYFTKQEGCDDIRDFQSNALAILFPYARAIVTTYTASANVTPLILPTVNINKVIAR